MTPQFPQSYNKSFKTIDEQIELLKSRGMLFRDENQAKHYLLNLNYYRLSGYWLPFKESDESFNPNLYFEDIINLYLCNKNKLGSIYNTIVICDYILKKIDPKSTLSADVEKLAEKHGIDKSVMGYES